MERIHKNMILKLNCTDRYSQDIAWIFTIMFGICVRPVQRLVVGDPGEKMKDEPCRILRDEL